MLLLQDQWFGWLVGWLVDLGGFWVKIDIKVTKTTKIDTCLLGIVVFPWKKPPEAPRGRNSTNVPLAEPPGRPKADFWAG